MKIAIPDEVLLAIDAFGAAERAVVMASKEEIGAAAVLWQKARLRLEDAIREALADAQATAAAHHERRD